MRLHGTTWESPRARYDRDERFHMGVYLSPAYLTRSLPSQQTRKVDKTGLIAWHAGLSIMRITSEALPQTNIQK